MGGGMGELVWFGDIVGGVDIGIVGLQEFVGVYCVFGWNVQFFEVVVFQVGGVVDGDQYGIERNVYVQFLMFGDQDFFVVFGQELFGVVFDQYVDVFGVKMLYDQFGNFGVFVYQQVGCYFNLSYCGVEVGKGLGQF